MMNRRIIAMGTSLLALASSAEPTKSNVIVIVADDLGYSDLSCYGASGVSTPNIDSLANAGIRFTNAHACASTSTPSRYSLITGMYPFRKEGTDVAAGNAGMIIHPEQYTIADVFKSAGYKTAVIGKWHLGVGSETGKQDWNSSLDRTPKDLGFDYHYIMAATGDRVPCVYIEEGRVCNWDKDAPIEVSYDKPFEGEPLGRTHPELLTNLVHSHGHDMSIVNGIGRIGYMKGGGKALWKDEHIADSITVHAVDFIRRNKDEQIFMYLCTNDIHVPRFPGEKFRGASGMGYRGDAVLQLDWTVGEVMKTLKELDLDDDTIIILTSDNGPVLDDGYQDQAVELVGDHRPGGDFRGGKYSLYEAGHRVPFIVNIPQETNSSGKVSQALVSQIDFVASMAALVGVDVPDGMAPDSENQLSAWLGDDQNGREHVVIMSYDRSLAIRDKKWKYIAPGGGPAIVPWGTDIETGSMPVPQLYDLENDPGETTDLSAGHPEISAVLREVLEQIISR